MPKCSSDTKYSVELLYLWIASTKQDPTNTYHYLGHSLVIVCYEQIKIYLH
jgi:hypothetical protein